MKSRAIIYYLFTLVVFTSCSQRNLTYLSNIKENEYTIDIQNRIKPRIQADDILAITVSTLSPESNTLFNGGTLSSTSQNSGPSSLSNTGYLVDANGFINFPVVGQIKIGGLTIEEANEKLTTEIKKLTKNPIINIRFSNFKISVIGEVNNPSTFTIPTEKINIFQALALAGDLTVNGKRENAALIREKDGKRTVVRINLNNKEVLSSPYFYLQQNDIIYIEPDESKAAQANISRSNFQYGLSIGLSLISILALLIR